MNAGRVIHLELHTRDREAAVGFLSALLGWRAEQVGPYTTLSVGDRVGGGIVECGLRPAQWVPYAVVEDVGAATERAGRLGASVLLEPREGSQGWRSVVASPVSGAIALWELKTGCL